MNRKLKGNKFNEFINEHVIGILSSIKIEFIHIYILNINFFLFIP